MPSGRSWLEWSEDSQPTRVVNRGRGDANSGQDSDLPRSAPRLADGERLMGSVKRLHSPPLPPLQRRRRHRRRAGLRRPPRQGRQDVRHRRRRDEHGGAGAVAGGDDPAGQGARHLLHRRQPRRGHLQPRGARPLRARAQLPRPLADQDEVDAARAGPQPRHRHLHPRRRGDASRSSATMLELWKKASDEGQALLPLRVHVPADRERRARGVLPDRPEGLLAAGGLREEAADLRPRLGGLDPRQRLRRGGDPRRRRSTTA